MSQEEKGLDPVKSDPESQTGLQRLSELDFQEVFKFEDKAISLDSSECWMLNNRVMPFGKGSRRLAVAMGVEFLMPPEINIDGVMRSNPYIVWKEGKAIGIYIVKHGIAIAPEGIRYLQPNLDYVDLTALVAAMAMNTMDRVLKLSKDAAKNCTRSVFEKMGEAWEKPGDPDWFFIPTLDENTGIAFNQNEKGDTGDAIRKLQGDITMMKRNPLRKIQTATDRLVFEKLFPEALTAVDEKSIVKCDKFGNTKAEAKYIKHVKSATFTVRVPTSAPIIRQMLIEFGITLRDNDPLAREQKFKEVMRVLGGNIHVKELPAGPIQAEDIQQDYRDPKEVEEANELSPVPANMDLKKFKVWMKDQYRFLTDEQKTAVFEGSEAKDPASWQINKNNWQAIYALMMDYAGIAPPQPEPEPSPDEMRKAMLEWFAEQDGKEGILDPILKAYGHTPESNFDLIPDDQIKGIYSQFAGQLRTQEQNDDASS